MVMDVVEMWNQTVVWYQEAHKQGDFVSKRDWGDSLQLELYVLQYGAMGCGLYWPMALVCSDIKSLTEGAIGQYYLLWPVDWQFIHGLACAGFSVTAYT